MDRGTTLAEIADLCRFYADARERLADVSEEIRDERRAAVRRKMPVLKRRIAETSAAEDALRAAIATARDLFIKPKSRAIEGVKVGLRKLPGKVECDETAAFAAIRRKLPEQAPSLIRIKESLNKDAVRRLDGRQLAAVGVVIYDVEDEIVIRTAPDDLDRLVDTLLADDEDAS